MYPLTRVLVAPGVFTTEFRAKGNAIVQVLHYSISLVIVSGTLEISTAVKAGH